MWGALGKKIIIKFERHISLMKKKKNSLKSMIFVLKHSTMFRWFSAHVASIKCWDFPHHKNINSCCIFIPEKRKILSHGGDDRPRFECFLIHKTILKISSSVTVERYWRTFKWLLNVLIEDIKNFIYQKKEEKFCVVLHVLHSWNFI